MEPSTPTGPYWQGVHAFKRGVTKDKNIYSEKTDPKLYEAWENGWTDAENGKEKE